MSSVCVWGGGGGGGGGGEKSNPPLTQNFIFMENFAG